MSVRLIDCLKNKTQKIGSRIFCEKDMAMDLKDYVRIFDTTLRDGEQCPGAAMTENEKLEIASQLATMKVDIIEAGFPVSSPVQFQAVERIARETEGPMIAALARAMKADIEAASKALQPAKKRGFILSLHLLRFT